MNVKGMPFSPFVDLEERGDSIYPMYFGVSCAFFALNILSRPEPEDERWLEICREMLRGSAQLLGLLVWRVQQEEANGRLELLRKLEIAEKEIEELKNMRREDARANEKVVRIFASQEQSWLIERKKLRQHIGALMNELRIAEKSKAEATSELTDKLKEMELSIQFKDRAFEEEQHKRKDLEEKLTKAENIAEELRETVKREAKEHSTDIWKHKTAFLELVSNQRQLEAEMSRAQRQLEAKKVELDSVVEQKEESVFLAQKLSVEVVKMRKDLDQKDKILSAMLRKSKQDTAEKQMLLNEVKLSKAKKKQAEPETERWRLASDSRRERHSLRSMFSYHTNSKSDSSTGRGATLTGKNKSNSDHVLGYEKPEFQSESEAFCSLSDYYSLERNDEPADVEQLDLWVRSEAEKYATALEKRHHLEIEAFAEQMRLKDEKLEAFRWQLLSKEIESKRLQSHVEGLNREVSQFRHENMKLEALLLDRQQELNELTKQFTAHGKFQSLQANCLLSDIQDPAITRDTSCSKVKIAKRKPMDRIEETISTEISEEIDAIREEDASCNLSTSSNLLVQSPGNDLAEDVEIPDQSPVKEERANELDHVRTFTLPCQPAAKTNNLPWKMDLHALGVSYKIKRLKQLLLVLDRLTGRKESGEDSNNTDHEKNGVRSLALLISLLNKHVSRYESLHEKTDELCKRMHNNNVNTSRGESSSERTKQETKSLEHFLEETFQLQRYMVATGQKLMEVQSKITSIFVEIGEELDKSTGLDAKCFAESMRTLLQEVQRGLEVRIARIIGDLEGTLACEGMIRMRR